MRALKSPYQCYTGICYFNLTAKNLNLLLSKHQLFTHFMLTSLNGYNHLYIEGLNHSFKDYIDETQSIAGQLIFHCAAVIIKCILIWLHCSNNNTTNGRCL